MFQLYLLLRLKNFGRIVIELGIFRIVFLTILTVAAIMILFLAETVSSFLWYAFSYWPAIIIIEKIKSFYTL